MQLINVKVKYKKQKLLVELVLHIIEAAILHITNLQEMFLLLIIILQRQLQTVLLYLVKTLKIYILKKEIN